MIVKRRIRPQQLNIKNTKQRDIASGIYYVRLTMFIKIR
jgi:hypothetical protein